MKGPTSRGGEAIVSNIQRSSCCAALFQHADVRQWPRTHSQCQGTAVMPSSRIGAQKQRARRKEKRESPQQAFLSLCTLFAALCCEELLAGCRFWEVGRERERGLPPPLAACRLIQPLLPIPPSVIPKAWLSVTVLENPTV